MSYSLPSPRIASLRAGSALLALACMPASPAHAQNSAQPSTPTASVDTQEIVVTGSRVARTALASTVPLSVLNNTSIEESGATNIQDAIAQLPAVGQNLSRSDTNFATTGNGVATLNLRNHGSQRSLVLINGKRSVGFPGSSATDLNNIPSDFVERVEIVTGGASAVYGSEAISGVANFILKDKFDGVRLRAQSTLSDKGDAARQFGSFTAGHSFADDTAHLIVNLSYDNDHGLRSRDRSFSAHDVPNRSSYAAQGLFSFNPLFLRGPTTYTFDRNNNLKQYEGANVDGYNRNNDRYLSLPVERYSGALIGNVALGAHVTAYVEGEYTHTKAANGLEPLATGNIPPVPVTEPDGSPYPGIPLTNPYIPQALLNAVAAYNAAGAASGAPFTPVTTLQFRRRSNDIFDRSSFVKRDFYRGVAGVKGNIGDTAWHWDVYYEHSQTTDRTRSQNALATNYGAALNAIRDASGNIVCDDPVERAAGCVPINIFGFNTVSPAAAKWLQTDPGPALGGIHAGDRVEYRYHATVKQDVADASITGHLFNLPGGAVNLAAGVEYRRESSSEKFDPYTQQGIGLGNQLANIVGKFNVKEAFAEVVAPLLADRPWVHALSIEGAVRYAHYSTVGSVTSWKAGGDYAPSPSIRFRGVYAQATRAPNIGELFTPPSQTFPAVVDPCDQGQGQGDNAVIDPSLRVPLPAKCASIPGVQATAQTPQGFTYSTAQIQGVSGLLGGNTALREETAHTITAGVVLTPTFIPSVSLTVDYYRIKVKNAIGFIGQQTSLDECYSGGNPLFCNNIIRNAQGFVTAVNALNLNTGSNLVEGIDVEFHGRRSLSGLGMPGTLDLAVYWNHLLKQQQVPFPGAPVQKEVGQLDCYSCGRLGTGFHNKIFATTTYAAGGLTLNYRVNYYSPVVDDVTDPEATRVPAFFYHNVQLRYDVGKDRKFGIYFGINNLTDKKPPIFPDTSPVTFPGTQTVADTYDTFGRMLYAGVEVHF